MSRCRSAVLFLIAASSLTIPSAALAQTKAGPYFSAGIAFERRNLGYETKTVLVGQNSVTKTIRPIRPGPVGAVGMFLTKRIGVEAEIERSASLSTPYKYTYSSGCCTENIAEHHDTLLLGNLRIRAKCWSAVCLEPVAGAGIALHHSSSEMTASCGTGFAPQPCTPASKSNWNESEPKFAFNFGMDMGLGMKGRVAIVPSFRIHFTDHNGPLHGTDHRVPSSGDRWFLAFGASISVR